MEWIVLVFAALLFLAFLIKGKVSPEDKSDQVKQWAIVQAGRTVILWCAQTGMRGQRTSVW